MEDRRCTVLLVHCHYRLPGGEDAVFAAERRLLEAHGHRVIVYERNNRNAGPGRQAAAAVSRGVQPEDLPRSGARCCAASVSTSYMYTTHCLRSALRCFGPRAASGSRRLQTLHNFRLFCPSGVLMRGGQVCEDCPLRRGGLLNAVRHACYRGSRAQSAVCAFVYAFHRLLGTYRHVSLIALTGFDRDKLLALTPAARCLIRSIFF